MDDSQEDDSRNKACDEIDNSHPADRKPRSVRVGPSHVGMGVFARRSYPATSVVGEITGEFINDPNYSSEYCIEIDAGMSLEPVAPFRFLNHSCEPNCEFDFFEPEDQATDVDNRVFDNRAFETSGDGHNESRWVPEVLLYALRNIEPGEELTIDYNWPASHAIRCRCGAPACRGWVVSEDAVDDVF